jgi:hypothetical protein
LARSTNHSPEEGFPVAEGAVFSEVAPRPHDASRIETTSAADPSRLCMK